MRHDDGLCFNVKQLDLLNHFFFTITLLGEMKRMRKKMEGMEREWERDEKRMGKGKGEGREKGRESRRGEEMGNCKVREKGMMNY